MKGCLNGLKIIFDEENGLRKSRITIDQFSLLTHIVELKLKCKQSTFCAFIDTPSDVLMNRLKEKLSGSIVYMENSSLGFIEAVHQW